MRLMLLCRRCGSYAVSAPAVSGLPGPNRPTEPESCCCHMSLPSLAALKVAFLFLLALYSSDLQRIEDEHNVQQLQLQRQLAAVTEQLDQAQRTECRLVVGL